MSKLSTALAVIATAIAAAAPVCASLAQAAGDAGAGPAVPTGILTDVQVTAQRLNEARSSIETQTGASVYSIDAAAIAAVPGGDNTLLNQVIMQAPEVAQDSFGQFHIRGEHNGLQYRLNGVILPEGISVFGQSLDPRLISTMNLVTGALPAEYGLRTAGIIDLTTKSGALDQGGAVSVYGGSHGTIEPSATYGGTSGRLTYFVSGGFLRNDLGIESPDGSSDPLHDHTTQLHGFGYLEDILDDSNRITLMIGSSSGKFQIPDLRGGQPTLGLVVNGQTQYPSEDLNENQREVTQFGIVSLQHSAGPLDIQSSLTARYSSLTFVPDPTGDVLYNGVSQDAYKKNIAYAWQTDAAYKLDAAHTLRAGLFVQSDTTTSDTTSQVLQTDPVTGLQTSDMPISIIDNIDKTETIESVYVQDEWKIASNFTVNYGLRYDRFTAFTKDSQLSPRLNLVWLATPTTTVHAGYSRYMSPPPFELVGVETISKFANTTGAPAVTQADPPLAEKANYFDFGIHQKLGDSFTTGLDSYYKQSVHLIDEGQFGAPIILTPFNYRYGKQYGVEWTTNFATQALSIYTNLSWQSARGKDFESAQFNFSPDDLTYVSTHFIHLDHEQQVTASGGVSYLISGTRISGDFLVGSGLRSALVLPDGSSIPNGDHLPYYTQINGAVTHAFDISGGHKLSVRFDVINMLDKVYQIRNGTGVGVGAPQYGPRRGFFGGLSLTF